MRTRFSCHGALVLLILASFGCSSEVATGPSTGVWHAWLDSPGGALPFGIELSRDGDEWSAVLRNGHERLPVERTTVGEGEIVIRVERYDSEITAGWSEDGRRLDGDWRRTAGPAEPSRLKFHATLGEQRRFPRATAADANGVAPAAATGNAPGDTRGDAEIGGRWRVSFSSSPDDDAVGVFEVQDDSLVEGTFLTTTGDYRTLAGTIDGDRLRLSVFDGGHAFLFDARLEADGTLRGDFWSRDLWHETWTAVRDDTFTMGDPFQRTAWIDDADLSSAVFPDLDGRPRALDDPAFDGQAKLIVVFGTWCPNCNDASDDLVQLHARYRDRGLSILGLAFEMTGDLERDTSQVSYYRDYHHIEYPLLIAGLADKDAASDAFPLIDRVRAFPTIIFLDGGGEVRAVHSGYVGPAAGPLYEAQQESFVGLIEELLAGGDA